MPTDVEVVNEQILRETKKLAADYAERFKGDALGELQAWLQIAARREAMVSQVYGISEREYRLPEPRPPAGDTARQALTLIYKQEAVHTRFMQVWLDQGTVRVSGMAPSLMTWLGQTEGKFLGALTSRPGLRRALSYFAVRLGALVTPEKVPDFTKDLSTLNTEDFFLLCGALETTARQSYERMEVLTSSLVAKLKDEGRPDLELTNLLPEITRIKRDEAFHEQAFREMVGWLVDGKFDSTLTKRACTERLAELLPKAARGRSSEGLYTLTDGGLGPLFRDNGVSVIVEDAAPAAN